jgi:hypothetical protein
MRYRYCDNKSCRKEMKSGEVYYAVIERKTENKKLIQNHVGDLCSECFNKIMKGSGK